MAKPSVPKDLRLLSTKYNRCKKAVSSYISERKLIKRIALKTTPGEFKEITHVTLSQMDSTRPTPIKELMLLEVQNQMNKIHKSEIIELSELAKKNTTLALKRLFRVKSNGH